jgi:hypothetical protein
MSDYMPKRDGDLENWEENFKAKLGIHGSTVGLTPAEITISQGKIDSHLVSYSEMLSIKKTARAKVASNNKNKLEMRGNVRPLVQRIKNHPNYTEEIGKDLGIIAAEKSTDYNNVKPKLKLSKGANGVTISYRKKTFHGIKIYSKRGNEAEFSFLADDSISPYIDARPNLDSAKAELREYYAIYIFNDDKIGVESEIYKITV